jgi:hypothetical protein
MAGRPTVLNGQVYRKLLEALRGGAFDWVAAEAAGIHRTTFYNWMARGEQGQKTWAVFARSVMQARAQARLRAEGWVMEQDPLSWLRLGPGRERRGQPGWTEAAKAQVDMPPEELAGAVDPGLEAQMERVLQEIGLEEDGDE